MNGKRILAGILLAAMLASLMPAAAFAEDTAAVAEIAVEAVRESQEFNAGDFTIAPTGAVEDAAAADIIDIPAVEDVPPCLPIEGTVSPKATDEGESFAAPIETAPAEEVTAGLQASYSGSCGDNLTWELDTDTGVLTIFGMGEMTDFDYGDAPWYSYCSSIQTVTIGDSVTSIGNRAFYWCYRLTSVTIPDGVTAISSQVFSNCSSLTSVTIPSSVTSIEDLAFCNCSSLTSVIYRGTEEAWNAISIAYGNEYLLSAERTYNAFVVGDINGDDVINAKDVTIQRRFLAGGYSVTLANALIADVNKDGIVNAKDVTILRRHVAGDYGVVIS